MSSGRGPAMRPPQPLPPSDSVGSLLAAIANSISDAIRILNLSDKRLWGLDEVEQLRALEQALDEARKDFQELSPLVNGQLIYEADRTHDSLVELRQLRDRHAALVEELRGWSRSGGPIEATWMRATLHLRQDLHRSQCRAARRIFTSGQDSSARCLGAFLVRRVQRARKANGDVVGVEHGEYQRRHLEELRTCRRVGGFQRFGELDMAFICDFCDGHIIWTDVERVPSAPTTHEEEASSPWPPVSPPITNPITNATTSGYQRRPQPSQAQESWQATAHSMSRHREKQVVFAPLAIANHVAPHTGDWLARIICPFCEEEASKPLDEDDDDQVWRPDSTFEDVDALQEHLEWYHGPKTASSTPATNSCGIM
ncbi:hypothetical protein GMORB2_2798 [Geosmithia morbida]|uniref:Uncharacterized protein n=1 Tax=Geosmithia morbida TaxID=1094350 RepID=A0A9P4YTL6_9HYPO|nr:uncharacterized protein GMORB2_2798 [Geosmithia morbida]KAF4120794.1 hypothetical protein GMORB2_2798 [Geosmithia morbida]